DFDLSAFAVSPTGKQGHHVGLYEHPECLTHVVTPGLSSTPAIRLRMVQDMESLVPEFGRRRIEGVEIIIRQSGHGACNVDGLVIGRVQGHTAPQKAGWSIKKGGSIAGKVGMGGITDNRGKQDCGGEHRRRENEQELV